MSAFHNLSRFGAFIVVLPMLCACGGGGGGGSVNNGSLTLSTSTMNFVGTPGSSVAPQTITATLSGNITGTVYIRVVSSGSAVAAITNVQITGPTTGQATVIPASPSSIGMGVHSGTITVTACTSDINCASGIIGSPQTVNVTYTVNGLTATPTSLSYTIMESSTAADYTKQLQVTAYPNVAASALAAANFSFTVTPATTANTYTVDVTLARPAADFLSSGQHLYNVTLSTTSGGHMTIPVTVNVMRPQLTYAFPQVEPANTSGETILRGAYLNLVAIGEVRFGNVAAPIISASDTEIRVQRPALPAGSYQVHFFDTQGTEIDRSQARLVTVDTLGAPAQVLSYPNTRDKVVSDLIFDAERNAIVIGMRYPLPVGWTSELIRYAYTNDWSAPTARDAETLQSIALRPDGLGFMTTSQINNLTQNALGFCTPGLESCANHLVLPASGYRLGVIGMPNDGEAVILGRGTSAGGISVQRYSLLTSTLRGTSPLTYGGTLGSSRDGSSVVFGESDPSIGAQPLQSLNAVTGVFTPSPFAMTISRIQLDRTGGRLLIDKTQVYNASFTLLGTLPSTTLSAVLSDDGTRAYTFDQNLQVRVFDITGPPYTEISSIPPAGNPGPGTDGNAMKMVLSPDERTLVMAGNAGVVIVPLP